MLIGICGSICSGKHTTAEYLVQHHGFLRLHLPTTRSLPQHEHIHSPSSSSTLDGDLYDAKQKLNHERLLPSVTDQRGTRGLTFPDVDSLLEFVTKRWREHWVLTDIVDEATLEALLRRPFFLLINVDAPVGLRYKRFSDRRKLPPMPILDFISYNDLQLYGSATNLTSSPSTPTQPCTPPPSSKPHHRGTAHLHAHAHLQILNSFHNPQAYSTFLSTLDLASPTRLRPTWDAYFMTLASLASQRSNCMKRRVGCVLVHNSRIISTGYNGTPRNLRNCNEGGCERCNAASSGGSALSTCLCLHAEENALLEAGRERIREGAVLYCDTCPCLTCSVKIAQVGVKEVVFSQSYNMDDASRRVLREAGVGLRQFSPPRSGLLGWDGIEELGFGGLERGDDPGRELVVVTNGK
ncbi:hypothetical protein LTR84_012380 [Exophiala bonariae]|uniref:Deoxycytidylate deaminase n=1 Tax=Exophiala bonariae TaxID=1690606 RepID=A0AAV9NGG4_9EURO|nr:hypothetical protein LTR84_012380 [Exophiala bonariae]